jgi:LmbE family N-acetylglucosaminyl deacetylase
MGHAVKFLSLTCGDAGHHEMDRFALAARRKGEADEAARRLGVCEYEVLDTHDGELMPTLETRHRVLRVIRQWNPEIVISLHYEPDGHPDHRASGRATADAVQFCTLRNVLPEVPAIARQPIHLLMPDFNSVEIHRHDVAIDVDDTIEQKLLACDAHATQFYEFAPHGRGVLHEVPEVWEAKREYLLAHWPLFMYAQEAMRPALAEWYGAGHAATVTFAETFQFAPRSKRPMRTEMERLFPMMVRQDHASP